MAPSNNNNNNDTLTSFVNVENFIRAYSPDALDTESHYGFSTIDQFIERNIDLLLDSQEFNTIDQNSMNLNTTKTFSVRKTTYKTSEENSKNAFNISKLFNLNYNESLRVLSQMTNSWDFNNNASLITLTECILKERNSTINVISLLINDRTLPVLKDKYYKQFIENNIKIQIIQNLIKSIDCILENFNINDNIEIDPSVYQLSQVQFNDLLKMKNSYDLIYLTNILKLLTNLTLNSIIPAETVLNWFKVSINLTAFLQNNLASIIINIPMNIITKIESLVTVNSLLFLGLDTTISAINIDSPYFNDGKYFTEIQELIDDMKSNSILSYMWSFILYTKSFLIQDDPNQHSAFLQDFTKFGELDIPMENLSTLYAQRAETYNVLDAMINLIDSLATDCLYPTIMASFLNFQLNFIPITIEVSNVIKKILSSTPTEFVEKFLTSDIFEKKLSLILAKLPLIDDALIPFINICSSNIEFATFHLSELDTYTSRLQLGNLDYDLIDEDLSEQEGNKLMINKVTTNASDLIVLKKEVLLHPPLVSDENIVLSIPEDTKAKILQAGTTTEDSLLVFLYKYNGWSLIGSVLKNLCDAYVKDVERDAEKYQTMIISIIELISKVVGSEVPIEKSTEVLQYLSNNIENEDIVSVAFKIFEAALRKRDYTVACVCCEFTNSLVPNYPHFVWSYLARSDLLDRHGKTGLASTILGILELSSGSYKFTINLSKLANSLVEESLLLGTNMPSKTKERILNKIISHLLNIYESYRFWKFEDIYERFELGSQLTTLFSNVLYNIYGIDPHTPPEKKITNVLAKSAQLLINGFLGFQYSESNSANSLIKILTSYTDKQVYALGNLVFGPVYNDLVVSSFNLTTLLISLRDLLHMKPSPLEYLVFSKSSKLVDIYCLSRSLKGPIINLFNALLSVAWNENSPFLLSYLGETHSKIFVHVIESDLENPLDDFKLSNDLYTFLCALLESKQDGLSILFLTGDIATNVSINEVKNDSNDKSILTILKRNALKLEQLPDYVSCSLLDAIAYAFNTWVYNKNIKDDTAFIETLMKNFKDFKPSEKPIEQLSHDEISRASNKFRLVSRIVEIFALYTYSTNDTASAIYQLLNSDNLFDIIKPYFEIQGNDMKLLEDIDEQFNNEFPNLFLPNFKLSPLSKPNLSYEMRIFNIPLIETLYIGNSQPSETSEQKNMIEDIKNASLKLHYVNHQIAAAKAWGALLTSFIKVVKTPLKDTYIDIICHFLQTNIDSKTEGELLSQVFQERMEICFYTLFSFQKAGKVVPEKKLIKILSELIVIFKSTAIDYLKNVASSTNRAVYRPILRSVLIILDLVKNSKEFVELSSDKILEFFEWAFAKGVYLILSNMLADISVPATYGKPTVVYNMDDKIQDLFLLLSLFNKIKQLKPSRSFNVILASSLNEVGTIKVILNLYSSFPTIRLNEDPILGNLILTLVSELCTVKEISEKFITNGLFAVLLESPLSVALQSGDIRPETQPRLHNIWSNGLVSIILLLLSEFGVKILPEACLFTSYFSRQIQTAVYSWSDNKLAVSRALIRETTQLILLQKMLEKLNYQHYLLNSNISNSFSGDEDDANVFRLVIGLDTPEERRDLSITLNKLLTHPKYLNSRIIASTQEEQQMLEDETKRTEFVTHINTEIKELQKSLFETL